jgi:hypothetical protein
MEKLNRAVTACPTPRSRTTPLSLLAILSAWPLRVSPGLVDWAGMYVDVGADFFNVKGSTIYDLLDHKGIDYAT